MRKNWINFLGACALLVLCSCAGPHTPFGSLNLWVPQKMEAKNLAKEAPSKPQEDSGFYVSFYPAFQVLHKPYDLSIRVESFRGHLEKRQLKFFYNGIDVSSQVLSNAEISEQSGGVFNVLLRDLRLFEDGGQEFLVIVQDFSGGRSKVAYLPEPSCDLWELRRVGEVAPFKVETNLIADIEKLSSMGGVNPALMTALIAQESGFNPRAISWARAIGLTQITPLADQSLEATTSSWPRHDKITQYPLPVLKALVNTGLLKQEKDWRLIPQYSIQGGVLFLSHLKDYWEMPQNKAILETLSPGDKQLVSQVILASYNSGAARVKKALQTMGRQWRQSENLKAARQYVAKVSSFCEQFAR